MQSILAQEEFDETVDGRFPLSVLNLADHLQKYVSCQTVAPTIRLADFYVVEKIDREQGDGRGWGRQYSDPIILPRSRDTLLRLIVEATLVKLEPGSGTNSMLDLEGGQPDHVTDPTPHSE